MSKLKLTVIGVGLGGQIHMKRIKNSPDFVLDSIVAPDRKCNHEAANNEGVPIYHSLNECIENRHPDGIIIASPNKEHATHTKICIDFKIPALLEKPITSNLKEGSELCDLIDKTGARVLLGHHRAHNPILRAAKDAIMSGRLGDLVSFMGSAQFNKPAHYFEDGPWRKILGGGPILINMIHEVDNMRRLVGEIKEVQAISSNKTRGFEVEDTAAINIKFENGVLGTFMLSDAASTARSWEQTSKENPGYPNYADEDCYLISGTRGSLALPTMKLKYYQDDVQPSWWTPFTEETLLVEKLDPIEIQLKHFAEVIKGKCDPLVNARDGYRNLVITESIRKSAETKSVITIED